jgi:hypothetical protein
MAKGEAFRSVDKFRAGRYRFDVQEGSFQPTHRNGRHLVYRVKIEDLKSSRKDVLEDIETYGGALRRILRFLSVSTRPGGFSIRGLRE